METPRQVGKSFKTSFVVIFFAIAGALSTGPLPVGRHPLTRTIEGVDCFFTELNCVSLSVESFAPNGSFFSSSNMIRLTGVPPLFFLLLVVACIFGGIVFALHFVFAEIGSGAGARTVWVVVNPSGAYVIAVPVGTVL